jgi:acyl-CoA synthetase (AMP-forming)/AMP-acid ligase II
LIDNVTIRSLLGVGEAERIAIADQSGAGVTYAELRRLIQQTHCFLANEGIRKADVVATALKNDPQTAILLLALTSYCRVAPLNPAYRAAEIEYALRDVSARVLITAGDLPEAAMAAERCGVEVVRIRRAAAHGYDLAKESPQRTGTARADVEPPGPDDVALLLHTSGTTARPKQVALTQRNLYLSTRGVLDVLQLGRDDRCLLVMPLFHVHGLVAGLLATMGAGATVCCPPGFQATGFFSWLGSSQATWYTAVPAMHQAILLRAQRNRDILARHRLRFIRSASSMLYPQVLEGLEATFGVPVLNAYGMTEAAHQIASTRLPAGGSEGSASRTSVGYSSGPAIAVLNSKKEMAACGERGEVVLRGEQIIGAYLSPATANDTAFWNGWFRTGDEGFLDAEGALTLTGRLKEIINCGGEKISPLEVEEALLLERAVAQAVVFALPHPMLGEEVGAAVVLKDGAEAVSERVLLDAVAQRLARHKVPRSIRIVDEIPKGPTGKIQRIGMAERLNAQAVTIDEP